MKKIFLSYAHQDGSELAAYLRERLTWCGWNVWKDSSSLPPGEKFPEAISNALEQSEIVIVIVSPAALHSEWVNEEINMALVTRCHIIPVVMPGVVIADLPPSLKARNSIMMSGINDWESLNKLVEGLEGDLKIPRVFSFSGQTATIYKEVLLVGRSQWASENPSNRDELAGVAKRMWREYIKILEKIPKIAIVPPGYAPLALAFLAHIVKIPNILPKMYYPERGPDGFQVSEDTCIDLQQLRVQARSDMK